tara:strand:- start:2902 stop:4458 length:1557 start_codon:yes stop_codon:yes gene_type:complete
MQVDFSPIAKAGETMGNAFNQVGADIGGMIKLHKEGTKKIDQSIKLAGQISALMPELQPLADEALASLTNPDISRREKLAYADTMNEMIKIGVLKQDQDYKNRSLQSETDYRNRNLDLEAAKLQMAGRGGPTKWNPIDIPDGQGGTIQGFYDDKTRTVLDINGQPIGGELPTPQDPRAQGISDMSAMPRPMPDNINMGNVAPIGNVPELPVDQQAMIDSTMGVNVDGGQGVLPARQSPTGPRIGYSPPSKKEPLVNVSQVGNPPVGYERKYNPDGTIQGDYVIPGSVAEKQQKLEMAKLNKAEQDAKESEAKAAKLKQVEDLQKADMDRSGRNLIQNLNQALELNKKAFSGVGPDGRLLRRASDFYGGVTARVQDRLKSVESSMTIETMMAMKAMSPTGSTGFGALSEREGDTLRTRWANLDVIQDPETFQKEANRLMIDTLDKIHGSTSARAEGVKKGLIDPKVNAQIESIYPTETMDIEGHVIPRVKIATGPSASPIKPQAGSLLTPEAQAVMDSL